MKRLFVVGLFTAVSLAGCRPMRSEETEVFAAVLAGDMHSLGEGSVELSAFTCSPPSGQYERLHQALGRADIVAADAAELVRDMRERNLQPSRMPARVEILGRQYSVRRSGVLARAAEWWTREESGDCGIYGNFSRPGFNQAHSLAVIYTGSHAFGEFWLLRRSADAWVPKPKPL